MQAEIARGTKREMVMTKPLFLGCSGTFRCEWCKQPIEEGERVYHFSVTDHIWHKTCHDHMMAEQRSNTQRIRNSTADMLAGKGH
jgi:hypothetical protein